MFKKLLYGIVAMTALFHSSTNGQTRVHTTPDSLINKKLITCGVSASYFKSLARTSYSGSSTAIISPSSFPSSAIDTCGKFRVFYADRAISSGKGFDETIGGKGINRRAVVCNVLSYVQSVIDFSKIPSSQYIRLYVDTSYSSTHPAPILTKFYAAAGARFLSTTTGVVDGDVHDYIISGSDPSTTGDYHAELIVNFDKTYFDSFSTKPIVYNDSLGAVSYCTQDLYSTILHEITHTLGWSSLMPVLLDSVSTASFSQYTSIDTSLHTHAFGTPISALSPAFSGGKVIVISYRQHFWINGMQAPYNHPVFNYSEDYTPAWTLARSFAHLDDDMGVYAYRARNSPGDFQNYVMSPFGHEGEMRRSYTKGELETLHNILGYTYNSSISGTAVATNKTAWSSKMNSVAYNSAFTNEIQQAFHEKLKADTVITNDSGTVWVYRLNADTTLKDADGDSLSVYPNSLVNFRGAGNGGNNHNQISISPDGKTISYTPRHNFYGRCQFGYNLSDGKEKGGFVLMTVDVKKGNNVNAKTGENLVLNGDFEEGSEVKIRNESEDINNTALISRKVGRLHGAYFSDSHPYDYWSNAWTPYGGGTAVRNTLSDCDSLGVLKSGFGSPTSSFPLPAAKYYFPFAPTPPSNLGNRYQHIFNTGYYYLADSLRSCHNYIFETDVYMPAAGMKFDMRTLFTDSGKLYWSKIVYDSMYTKTKKFNHKITPDISETFTTSGWQHIKIPFSYCSSTPSDLLVLELNGFILDNLSIKEDTNKLTVKIADSAYLPCNNTRLWAKLTNVSKYTCLGASTGIPLKYTWTANGDTINIKDSIIYVTPLVATKYKISVFDGCHTTIDSISLAPKIGLSAYLSDTSMCKNDSITLSPIVTGTVGTVTYSWSPSTGLSCSTCASPKASPSITTNYTLTITDSVSCFKRDVLVTVLAVPNISVNDTSICESKYAELRVSGASLTDTYLWLDPSVSCVSCGTTNTPILTTNKDFIVKVTNLYGCSSYDTASVTVLPVPTITVFPKDTTMCSGDSIVLSASGGITYRWIPATALSCLTCSTTKASPSIDMAYVVTGSNIYGCTNSAIANIKVLKSPSVIALPADTSICGTGYITLSASGASTYSWTPSAGLTSPTSASTAAFVTSTTSYVVRGVDTNGCIGKDTVNVTVKPKPSVSVSTPFVNLCSSDSVSLNASGAVSYVWTPSTGGIACPTCPITKAKPASFPITYTVTGTGSNGCTNTATVYASLVSCACTPSSVFGTSATTLTTATLPTTLVSGYYYLPNNLNISSNTVMTGAKILIERDVTITVANNAKLTLDNCHLFTCDEDTAKGMWRGIILASTGSTPGGSSGRIEVKNNTLIEDALFAIDAINLHTPSSGDVINVSNSTFNRNQVDISMNGYKVSSPAILPINIKGNLFTARKFSRATMSGYPNTWTSTAVLKATTSVSDSKPPYFISKSTFLNKAKCKDSNIFSYLGIRTNNMGQTSSTGVYQSEVKIGEGAAVDDYNLFDNHQFGLVSYNSNISAYHNHFINISRRMIPSPSTTAPVSNGMAMILQSDKTHDTRAQVLPSGFGNLTNKFHDCFMGIYTENVATLNISSTNITKSDTAGGVVAGAAYTWETYTGYGMMLHNEGINKSNTISTNTISNVNVGIHLALLNPKPGAVTTINNNSLNAQNPDAAYALYRSKQYLSYGMNIYSSSPVLSADNVANITNNTFNKVFNGIMINGLKNTKCSTTNNTIILWDTLTPVTSSYQYGIQAVSTNEATISGNTLSHIIAASTADRVRGIMAGTNLQLRICGNSTTNIGRGFEFAKGADQTGTRWIENTMNGGTKGMVLASNIGNQGLTKDVTMFPPYVYRATLNKWNITGGGSLHTYVDGTIKSSLSKLYVRNISTGLVELPSPNDAFISLNRYINPSTLITAQLVSNCSGTAPVVKANPIPSPSFGLGKTLGLLIIADSLGYDATYNKRQWMNQLSLYELGTIDPSLRDSSKALDSFMTAAANSRFAWITNVEKAINSDSLSLAQTLLNTTPQAMGRVVVNSDLIITDYSDANDIVSNYNNYYIAYLHYLQGTMTSNDSTALQSIADKCPVTDGAVVYKARTLYQFINKTHKAYYDEECDQVQGISFKKTQNLVNVVANEYSLFPNPNNGVFSISQSVVEEKEVSLKLYNALGQEIAQEKVTFKQGIANFKVQNASVGLYLICITEENNKTTCLKFNIQ